MGRQRAGWAMVAVTVMALVAAGCSSEPEQPPLVLPAIAPPTLDITPAAKAKQVPVSAEIAVRTTDGRVTALDVTDDKGVAVRGAMRADGSSWVPAKPLGYQRTYTVAATATGAYGQATTQRTSFTTMAKPTRTVDTTLYFFDQATYGVAMPVTLDFSQAIPKSARAAVQRRLFVTTEPPQPGAWHWLDSGTEVFYRAPDYWRPGTKITVRMALEGVPMGAGIFGDADRTATAKIGNSVFLDIDNRTKQMTVTIDGKVAKRIPVSMGKPNTPTSSGKMVIMEKHDRVTFDTRNDPQGGYVVTVSDAQRLTWGGEFIHAAPWSEGDQGYSNVSHGCTNVSSWAASYLMGITHVGDLVTIKGTEVTLDQGNGWTAWNMTWDEFVRGSALDVPADLKPAPAKAAAPKPSAVPVPVPSPTN
ncbi:lipoprotein-anchoring transpeptidase ErfK/SrfK [Allocatelliglobosispora scoriae]|uniref:Lipoprotein-anchoring transpeptidase ErfK/SrfK n=1 Tax=Allocatelliglobosispora scoriae TaxID=643052 RepID=A0A841BQQ5_9ACTN|nr:Ig-like domain-containing protein [Allocatelliglobosispora scoriae]MBB5869263.1 lipoprotein-anchoring transpeptidase ErfK/SrfK [Allocatelliglobosispora scoriae]